jgi:LCP family protein required for cell wall assembly
VSLRTFARHVVVVTVGFALGLGALVASWLGGYRVPFVSGTTYVELTKLDHAGYAGQSDGLVFIALIGSDYRPGLGGARGDALHVLALNPALNAGTMLNVPRDTCAQVPGRGTSKINNAHSEGGAKLQAEVLAEVTGAPIRYAVSVDFDGFSSIVDGVGGVDVDVPFEMSDRYSGAFFSPGRHHFGGRDALAFSRDRHDFGPGDIQRSWNQAYLVLSAFRGLRTQYASPAKRFELLALLHRHSEVHGASLSELFRLGQAAFDVDPAQVKSVTIPTSGGDCLRVAGEAVTLFADFVDDGVLQSHNGGAFDNPTGR